MRIEWSPSPGPTLGVEWEVQLIDAKTRLLRQDAGAVLAGLPGLQESGEHPKMRHELMQSTVEVVTGICGTVAEAKADLAVTIKDLQRTADRQGIVLAAAGTHPMSYWQDAKTAPVQRYSELVEQLQWLARRLQTYATHVHVGLRDETRAMPIINALASYLPHFLGLTASSPFWSGSETGLASTRSVIFGALPNTGPPPGLPDWRRFEEYMETQLRAGTIRTIKEVWWDVRPHPDFGTVEIRIADAVPTFREVGMVAALAQCLVQLLDSQLDRGYRLPSRSTWVVRDNKWRATRYGLDAVVITDDAGTTAPLRDEIYELLKDLEPIAWRLGCAEELAVASEVLELGASYERQRAAHTGDGDLTAVVDALVTEFAEDRFVLPDDGGLSPANRGASRALQWWCGDEEAGPRGCRDTDLPLAVRRGDLVGVGAFRRRQPDRPRRPGQGSSVGGGRVHPAADHRGGVHDRAAAAHRRRRRRHDDRQPAARPQDRLAGRGRR